MRFCICPFPVYMRVFLWIYAIWIKIDKKDPLPRRSSQFAELFNSPLTRLFGTEITKTFRLPKMTLVIDEMHVIIKVKVNINFFFNFNIDFFF